MRTPELLVVGHIARDLVADGWRPGGAVTYAGLAAHRLGIPTAVVTSCGPDIDAAQTLAGLAIHCLPAPVSTTMENRYTPEGRRQRVPAVAAPIGAGDIPAAFCEARAVFLAPIFGEVSPEIGMRCGDYVAVGLQGWLRRRDRDGNVSAASLSRVTLPPGDVVFLSAEDLRPHEYLGGVKSLARRFGDVVVTHGAGGATLIQAGLESQIAAFPADEIDPTGAGDAFAAGFLVAVLRGRPMNEAMRWGACVASFVVEAEGYAGLPDCAALEARLAAHPGIQLA